jgi:branched-chain amino acid transport system substrate-binding protein
MKGAGDYRTQLLRIKQSEPDVIYVVAFPQDGGLIAKQARELRIKSEIINSDSGFHEDFVKAAQESGEGVFVSAAMSRMAPEYVEAYKAEYGSEPQLCGPQAYDIANILVETMRRVGTKSSAIKDALYEVRDYPGVAWNVSLDENGDLVGAAFEMNIVRDGEFQTYS